MSDESPFTIVGPYQQDERLLVGYFSSQQRKDRIIYCLGFSADLADSLIWQLAQSSPFLDTPRYVQEINSKVYFFYKVSGFFMDHSAKMPYTALNDLRTEVSRCLQTCQNLLLKQ